MTLWLRRRYFLISTPTAYGGLMETVDIPYPVSSTERATPVSVILFITRLLLAVIFTWSGLAKLIDRLGSRRAMLDLGVPARLVTPLAVLLPLIELVVAGLLIPVTSARLGAIAALILLLACTTAVGYRRARRKAPPYHCFGQAPTEPIGAVMLIRNLALAALASTIVLLGHDDAGVSVTGWLATTTPVQRTQLGLAILAAALQASGCHILVQLRHMQNTLVRRFEMSEENATVSTTQSGPKMPASAPPTLPTPDLAQPDLTDEI